MFNITRLRRMLWPVLGLALLAALAGCDSGPVVVVATPVPPDSAFRTYRHPSGAFSLRLPPDWSVRDVSQPDSIRVEFSPPNNPGLPLSVYVVNTGSAISAAGLLDAIERYQKTANADPAAYREVSRNAQGDGSWRVAGIRQTPIGPRQINTFFQADRSFLTVIDVDLTSLDEAVMQTMRAVVNTIRVDPNVVVRTGDIQPGGAGVASASGSLPVGAAFAWTNPQGVFIINGHVTNLSELPVEAIRVTALLYDAQDNVLAEQPNVLPVEILERGNTAPFSIRFRGGKPSQTVRYELQVAARYAEYALKTHLGDDKFLRGNDRAFYNASGFLTVSGDVVNRTQVRASFIKAIVAIYDEQGRVVATDSVFLSKPELLPGELARFEVTFPELGGNAARYLISIEGKSD